MGDKTKGLYQKYVVTKISDSKKKMDCIVLEFNDPIARDAIRYWAGLMIVEGYGKCGQQVIEKLGMTMEKMINKTS